MPITAPQQLARVNGHNERNEGAVELLPRSRAHDAQKHRIQTERQTRRIYLRDLSVGDRCVQ